MNNSTDINSFNNMEEMKRLGEEFEALSPEKQRQAYITLMVQQKQLIARMQQMSDQAMFKKLDYLFKVVELGVFDENFENKCKSEIELIVFGEETPEETEK